MIPVINKIDLDVARPEAVAAELVDVVGFAHDEMILRVGQNRPGHQ